MTKTTLEDWQQPEDRKAGAPACVELQIKTEKDGLIVEVDHRSVKLELQDGVLRVLAYDDSYGESPAILSLQEAGKGPIEADLSDHVRNRYEPEEDPQP